MAQWPLIFTPSSWAGPVPPPALGVYWTFERSKRALKRSSSSAGMGSRGWSGNEFGDELPEGGVEGFAAASGVGEDDAAAGFEVATEDLHLFGREGDAGAAVEVDEGVIDEIGVAGVDLSMVDDDVNLEGLARGSRSGWGWRGVRCSSRRRA